MALLFVVPAITLTATASGCGTTNNQCLFDCPQVGQPVSVTMDATIGGFVSAQAYCSGVFGASCNGNGTCSQTGTQQEDGAGTCTATSYPFGGWSLGCAASGGSGSGCDPTIPECLMGNVATMRMLPSGIVTGKVCHGITCRDVEPRCLVRELVVCGIGRAVSDDFLRLHLEATPHHLGIHEP